MNYSDNKSTDNQELHFFDLITILIDSRKLVLKVFTFIFAGFFLLIFHFFVGFFLVDFSFKGTCVVHLKLK